MAITRQRSLSRYSLDDWTTARDVLSAPLTRLRRYPWNLKLCVDGGAAFYGRVPRRRGEVADNLARSPEQNAKTARAGKRKINNLRTSE
jgi:hypothetical protein